MSYLEIAQAALLRAHARRELDQPVPPAAECRRQRLLERLRDSPGLKYAIETDQRSDGSHVISLAVPGATFELIVPVPRDPIDFARDLIELMDGAQGAKKAK